MEVAIENDLRNLVREFRSRGPIKKIKNVPAEGSSDVDYLVCIFVDGHEYQCVGLRFMREHLQELSRVTNFPERQINKTLLAHDADEACIIFDDPFVTTSAQGDDIFLPV